MWSQGDFTTLVSWFTVVIVCVFGGFSGMCKKFVRHYEMLRKRGEISGWSPKARTFKFMWTLIAILLITSGTLFTIGYANCVQDYYIAVCAVQLFQLLCLLSWGHLFCRMGYMRLAMGAIVFIIASSITVTVLMGLSLSSSISTCPADRTTGWISTFFWGVPTLWYMCALFINYDWSTSLKKHQLPPFWNIKVKGHVDFEAEASNSSPYGDDDEYEEYPYVESRHPPTSQLRNPTLLKPILKQSN
jgi:tryptophan-rich sensory protein